MPGSLYNTSDTDSSSINTSLSDISDDEIDFTINRYNNNPKCHCCNYNCLEIKDNNDLNIDIIK